MYKDVNERVVVMWRLQNQKILLHIFPHNQHVLVDEKVVYLYLEEDEHETYVPAIQLGSNTKRFIVHYKYLLEWCNESPKVLSYPKHLNDIIQILNHVRF